MVNTPDHIDIRIVPEAVNNFDDVGTFHEKFGLHNTTYHKTGPTVAMNSHDLMEFRVKFMKEELQEFIDGLNEGDIAQCADALIDLVYVVMGTAHFLGIPWQELWDDVQAANMRKVRAAADGSNSKRGSSFDVVKPPGWRGPRTNDILERHGFRTSLAHEIGPTH